MRILAVIIFFAKLHCYAQTWQWAKTGNGLTEGISIATDPVGNTYVAGSTMVQPQNNDIFIRKYDSNGNLLWSRIAGGTADELLQDIALDRYGNIFITGYNNGGPISFGSHTLSTTSFFLAKYDNSGSFLWAIGSQSGTARGEAIVTDSLGNVILTGSISYNAVIGSTLTGQGTSDILFIKYSSGGQMIFEDIIGGSAEEVAESITIDDNGNVYLAGYFSTPDIVFGTDTISSHLNFSSFLAKANAQGNFIWATEMNGLQGNFAQTVSCDPSGNVLISGKFWERIYIGSDTLLNETSGNGDYDAYLAKFDTNGHSIWSRSVGGLDNTYINSIATDSNGNIWVAGEFRNSIFFGTDTLVSRGVYDIFMAEYDSSGNAVWYDKYGDSGSETGNSIAVDYNGNIYLSGTIDQGNFYFGSYPVISPGNYGYYVAKLGNDVNSTEEFFRKRELTIFPNPSESSFVITYKVSKPSMLNISLRNSLGQIVYFETSGEIVDEYVNEIGTMSLQKGIYLLEIFDGEKRLTQKVITH